jgi:hypothetical protein
MSAARCSTPRSRPRRCRRVRGAPRRSTSSTCSPTCTQPTSTRSASAISPAARATSSGRSSGGRPSGRVRRPASSPDRRGRPTARRERARAAGCRRGPRRLPVRELHHRRRARPHRRCARLGAVHLGDPLADLGYLGVYWAGPDGRPRQNDPTSVPGVPDVRRGGRPLRQPHRARRRWHRLLRRVLVRGGWPSSARACTPATCTGRWAERSTRRCSASSGPHRRARRAALGLLARTDLPTEHGGVHERRPR